MIAALGDTSVERTIVLIIKNKAFQATSSFGRFLLFFAVTDWDFSMRLRYSSTIEIKSKRKKKWEDWFNRHTLTWTTISRSNYTWHVHGRQNCRFSLFWGADLPLLRFRSNLWQWFLYPCGNLLHLYSLQDPSSTQNRRLYSCHMCYLKSSPSFQITDCSLRFSVHKRKLSTFVLCSAGNSVSFSNMGTP